MDESSQKPIPAADKAMRPLFLTVLIDLLGFAMFIPDLQLRGEKLAKSTFNLDPEKQAVILGLVVGFGLAVYSIAQLFTGTWLGRMSDIKGRRPVLLFSAALSVVAYLLYGVADNIYLLYLSRALSGVAAANLGVAFAYVADVSSPQERAQKLGMLGAAFGIGFVFGPPLGAVLLKVGNDNPFWLAVVAAGLCALNVFFIWKYLPEPERERTERPKSSMVAELGKAFKVPGLNILLLSFFAISFAFTNLETTYFRLLEAPNWIYNFGENNTKLYGSLILTVVGIVGAITQGVLVGKIVPKLGELKTFRIFYTSFVPVFASVPYGAMPFPGVIGVILLGLTNGLSNSSINSMISQSAPADMRGTIMGLTQSLGSLARVVSPLIASPLFGIRPDAPYLWGAVVATIPAALMWFKFKEIPQNGPPTDEPVMGH